jgi:hypothetical protein
MKTSAAVFLCATLGLATAAGAADVPAASAKKAAIVVAAGATAVTPKPAKSDVSATRHNASPAAVAEGFRDPYQTPLLLNAKPLKGSQP